MVANTHHRWDHVGGNAGFSKVAIHELGEENLRAGQDLLFAEVYVAHARQRLARFGEFSEIDSKFYDFLADETPLYVVEWSRRGSVGAGCSLRRVGL